MSFPVKVGIIGLGWMGKTHADAYVATKRAKIVAVSDVNESLARSFADAYHVESIYTDYRDLAARDDIDIVDICTPPFNHTEVGIDVIRAGRNVSIQKPITLTLKDADILIEEAKKAGVQFFASYMFRFAPGILKLKSIVDEGRIGTPRVAYHRMLVPADRPGKWAWDKSLSGGMIVEMLTHGFDLFRWLFGDAESVYAVGNSIMRPGFTDNALINLKFKNGVVAHIEGSWTASAIFPSNAVEVIGDKGTVYIDRGSFNTRKFTVTVCDQESSQSWEFSGSGQYDKIEYLVNRIGQGLPIERSTGEDGRAALELALAATKSVETGEIVRLPFAEES